MKRSNIRITSSFLAAVKTIELPATMVKVKSGVATGLSTTPTFPSSQESVVIKLLEVNTQTCVNTQTWVPEPMIVVNTQT